MENVSLPQGDSHRIHRPDESRPGSCYWPWGAASGAHPCHRGEIAFLILQGFAVKPLSPFFTPASFARALPALLILQAFAVRLLSPGFHPSTQRSRAGDPGFHPSTQRSRAGDPGLPVSPIPGADWQFTLSAIHPLPNISGPSRHAGICPPDLSSRAEALSEAEGSAVFFLSRSQPLGAPSSRSEGGRPSRRSLRLQGPRKAFRPLPGRSIPGSL
jgi:hypothetical protein